MTVETGQDQTRRSPNNRVVARLPFSLPPTIVWFLGAVAVVTSWGLLDPGDSRQQLDWYLQDQMMQNRASIPFDEDILLVLEDDDSASLLGKTDARHRRARALRQLARLGARTVIFDYLLLDESSDVSFIDDEALFDGLPAATFRADADQDWPQLYTEDELQRSTFDRLSWLDGDVPRPKIVIPFHFRQPFGMEQQKLISAMARVLEVQSPTPTATRLAEMLKKPEELVRQNYKYALEEAGQLVAPSREMVKTVLSDPARLPLQWHVRNQRDRRNMLEQLAGQDSFSAAVIQTPLQDGELTLPLSMFAGYVGLGFAEVQEDRDSTLRRLILNRDWRPAGAAPEQIQTVVHQSLAGILMHHRQSVVGIKRDPDGRFLTIPGTANARVPLDSQGQLMINWHINDGQWEEHLDRLHQQVRLDDLFNLAKYDKQINGNRSLIRGFIVRLDAELQLGLQARQADEAISMAIFEEENPDAMVSKFHDRLVPRFFEHPRILKLLAASENPSPATDSIRYELQEFQALRASTQQTIAERTKSEAELRARVQDKLCLVGQVSTGSTDFKSTPVGRLPGIIVNAAAVNTMLTRRFLIPPSMGWTLLTTVLVMTLVAVLFTRLNVILATVAVIPLLLLVAGGHFGALVWNGWVTNPILPLAGVVACFVSITTRRWWQDNRQRRRVRRAFEFYLHPTVVQKVSEHPDALKLGGAATELSILFSDIRSFTSIAEQLRDDELTKLLNEYLTAMTNVVFDNSGTVDKYIGDAIMAFYGAPVSSTIHAQQSCRTALQMSQQLGPMRQHWQQQGLPPIRIGVGINTDTVRVGNFGSTVRFDYTVIGDGVNLAARLEGANKQYGTEILISESTWKQVHSDFATRELDLIQVKGRQRPTRIFELLGERPLDVSLVSRIRKFESALASYRAQDFAGAGEVFEALNAEHPGDLPVEMYMSRCAQFLQSPPGDAWDGVFVMTTK